MGNVVAASAPPPPPPMSVLAPPEIPKDQLGPASTEVAQKIENPGTVEELHKLCKDVFPTNFEGAKFMVNKALSNHFQISHTLSMSSVVKSGYKFGATYVGTKQTSPTEAYPVLLGDIESSGNLNANILHQFHPRIRTKVATQVQRSKFTAVQMTSDYRGDAFTASLTVANPDILNGSGVMVAHYLQNLTPKLALGGELAYQRGYGIPGGSIAVGSLVGRYTAGDSTISASLGLASCHLCFHQRASPTLQLGVELEVNGRIQESTATIAYQIDLPKADIVFRGSVDSNWSVGAVLEKKLQPLPFSFALSGLLNHAKGHFQLGCGLIIG
ncbi:mitochondrial import receptor subunit TOM40 homolog 1-like [Microplitis mediator]|uniref:mitochondrial import receptor subunit TOM40 homolog 1-like n=1 Tax=Microplitis mediator TaxID=375433 RepID=UPI00255313E4|nr:mitochondrial import receptor subunit TOM40 homolog 1-like [Microplitis mediator]